MFARLKLVGAAFLVVLLLCAGAWSLILQTRLSSVEQKLETAQRDLRDERALSESLTLQNDALRDAAEVRADLREKGAKEKAKAEETLNDALKANPDWSDSPAPAAVTDGLCSYIKCAKPTAPAGSSTPP